MNNTIESTRNKDIKNSAKKVQYEKIPENRSYVDILKKYQKKDDDDDDGSSYRNKFREMKILFLMINKMKLKLKSANNDRKIANVIKKQKQKELKSINHILSIVYNPNLDIKTKIERLNRVSVVSNLIAEIKKEVIQQLQNFSKEQKIAKQQSAIGLKNGILGIKFDGVAKILNSPLAGAPLLEQPKRKENICKKGTKKISMVHEKKSRNRKSKLSHENNIIVEKKPEKKRIGHFTTQELKRREYARENPYYRKI